MTPSKLRLHCRSGMGTWVSSIEIRKPFASVGTRNRVNPSLWRSEAAGAGVRASTITCFATSAPDVKFFVPERTK